MSKFNPTLTRNAAAFQVEFANSREPVFISLQPAVNRYSRRRSS
jgi:hypothetical protein